MIIVDINNFIPNETLQHHDIGHLKFSMVLDHVEVSTSIQWETKHFIEDVHTFFCFRKDRITIQEKEEEALKQRELEQEVKKMADERRRYTLKVKQWSAFTPNLDKSLEYCKLHSGRDALTVRDILSKYVWGGGSPLNWNPGGGGRNENLIFWWGNIIIQVVGKTSEIRKKYLLMIQKV